MKKYLFLLMAVFAIALTSCGNSHHTVKVGQEIYLKEDIPSANTDVEMWALHDLVIHGKKKEAMEKFYLGEACMIKAPETVTVIEIDHKKEYCKVRYVNEFFVDREEWVYIDDMFRE